MCVFVPSVRERGESHQKCTTQDLHKGQVDLSGNMSDHESDIFISHDNEQREETDTSSDVRRHPETKGLHFNALEDVFSYLNNVDESTWERMLPLISPKVHHLDPQPGSTIQQTGNSRPLTENWYRCNNVSVSCFGPKMILAIVAFVVIVLCLVFGILYTSSDVGRHPEQKGLHFNSLEDVFSYLNNVDDPTWERMLPLVSQKVHHLKALLEPYSACPPHWFWYQRKCYYFSEGEKNWTSSQDFCSSHNASLATITDEEKEFIHLLKGRDNFWIGLRRSPGQPWKWPNGDNATLEVFGDGGDCAFYDNKSRAMSSLCKTTFRWMCSKPDASEKPTE